MKAQWLLLVMSCPCKHIQTDGHVSLQQHMAASILSYTMEDKLKEVEAAIQESNGP